MKNFWIVLAGVGFVTLLRLTGVIGNLWFGLVVLASIGILAIINSIKVEKLNRLAQGFLVVMFLLAGGTAFYGFLTDAAPYTAVALDRRAHMEDARMAELANPPGLYALMSYRDMVADVESATSRRLRERSDRVADQYARGLMSRAGMEREVRLIGDETRRLVEWRTKASEPLVDAVPPQPQNWLAGITNTPARTVFWILGALLVAAAIGSMFTPKPVFKTALGVAFIVGLLLGVDHLLSGGGTRLWQELGSSGAHSAPQKNVIVVNIPSNNKLSDWVVLASGTKYDWDVPGDTEFVFPDGQIVGKVATDSARSLGQIPSRKFRLRGDPGTATFTPR